MMFSRIRDYWRTHFSVRLASITIAVLILVAFAFHRFLQDQYLEYLAASCRSACGARREKEPILRSCFRSLIICRGRKGTLRTMSELVGQGHVWEEIFWQGVSRGYGGERLRICKAYVRQLHHTDHAAGT